METTTPATVREIFVPATLSELRTIDPGEIRAVTLTLPRDFEFAGTKYPVRDTMRPGNAFLAKPLGTRTEKHRRRMYTRSNCAFTSPSILETIINHTHEEKADTSIWWQSDKVDTLQREGGTIELRTVFNQDRTELVVAENSLRCASNNLKLEPDNEWPNMRFLGLAFSTGITPFLSHLRYMKAFDFGKTDHRQGCSFTLIASARNPRQLMEHEELLALAREFPENFTYYPVLTRLWPSDWPYGKGRIIRSKPGNGGEESIDLGPLLDVVSDIANRHVRMCGNRFARNQLEHGLQQNNVDHQSFRAEVW